MWRRPRPRLLPSAAAEERGVEVLFEAPVTALARDGAGFRLVTPRGELLAERVINAAGMGATRLARLVGCDDALLFASGFAASVGAIPALIEPDDRVFSDVHNHASLIDGLRLAKARAELLAHGMTPPPRPAGPGLTWWVCEAIYSMDGDRCPIDGIRSHLADGGLVYLDEAHALGLFPGGAGLACARGVRPTVVVGTLGKALGCAGAFVAGSATTCAWLRGIARSHVFSTGLSPLLVAAIDRAVTLVTGPEGDRRRARLWANVTRAGELLGRRLSSPIVPIHVGDNHLAVAVSDALLARGWHVQAIRPPTVPPGTARLRLSLSADHTVEQLSALVADLDDVLTTFGRRLRQAS